MDPVSYEELTNHFQTKLDELQTILDLRGADKDDNCLTQLQMLQTELSSVKSVFNLLKSEQEMRVKKIGELKELDENAIILMKRLSYTVNNVPSRLPKANKFSQDSSSIDIQLTVNDKQHTAITMATAPIPLSIDKSHSTRSGNKSLTVKQENVYYPELEFLTTEEFEQIPKYQKGRISYDQVNKFIDSMNKAYHAKYKLLKQKKSSLNDANRKRYETYISQENKDTQGCYFIVEEDMKEFGGLKIDNVARSIITIIRHCGRCREVRGGKLTRYVYIETY